jgi:hypothetical protein
MALKFSTTKKAILHGVKVLVHSRAGIGKTTLCATAKDQVILSAEAGLLSIADHNIPVIEIETMADLEDAYKWITTSNEAKRFSTICLDSITEIAEIILANAKLKNADGRQAYGELIEKMMEYVKKFRDLRGKHVYMAAKQEREKDELTGRVLRIPGMPGRSLGPGLAYYFDEVFALLIQENGENSYRYLRTQPDFQYEAKDRSGILSAIEKPDLNYIFNKIINGVKAKTA